MSTETISLSGKRLAKRRQTRRKAALAFFGLSGIVLMACAASGLSVGFGGSPGGAQSDARRITGYPTLSRVIDADTIVVEETRVRLDGISAPERGHEAHTKGKWFVADLMREAKTIECDLTGKKSYDREVGTCFFVMADGSRADPQAEAVKAGLARDCPRYSGGRYEKFETDASRALPLPGYC